MKVFAALLGAALISGCVSPQSVMKPYLPPESCAALDEEMAQIAQHDAMVYTLRSAKMGFATSIPLLAAAGMIPPGWAWAGFAPMILPNVQMETHGERLVYLALVREIRSCPNGD